MLVRRSFYAFRGSSVFAGVTLLFVAIFLLAGATDALAESYEEAVEGTSGIAHFWPMGEGSGSSFADVVGSDDASVGSGVTLGEPGGLVGDSATSALFDGSSGAASASVDLSGTHELTVEFWMKWGSYGPDDRLALEFTPNFNENPGGFLVDPDATPGSDFAVSIGQDSSRNTVYFERPSAGAWHYYAFVIDTAAPAESEIAPYVDGKAVSYTKTVAGTEAGNFADSTLFWMSRDASGLFGAGDMQDLALYTSTLSAGTIAEHYELGEDGPKAAFTSLPVDATAGVPVRLDASGSTSPSEITDYAWDFDGGGEYATDGGSSSAISHTFSSTGTYTVELRVKDSTGATATVSHTITVAAALGGYEQEVEDTAGIQHFWPMGEPSGSLFADVFGGADASLTGGVTLGDTGGLVGDTATSALFDGSSGAAHAPVDLSGSGKETIEFWMKWPTFGDDDALALEFTPNFNESAGGFLVDPNASEEGGMFGVGVGEGASRNNAFFAQPSADAWHYYAFTIDTEASGASEITPYVDGKAVFYSKTESGTGGGFADSTLYWMSRDASSLFGSGDMQDLALYRGTLSSTTIAAHYEAGEGGPKASFTRTPAVASAGQPVHLDASGSSSPGGSLTDYAWDFDNSKSYATDVGSSASESHTFSSPGTYTVDLRVKDSLGETATTTQTITVGAALGQYEQAIEGTMGIAHFWPMGESSGSSFADLVGGANATLEGGVTLGQTGGLVEDSSTSALFDGSSGSAHAPVDLSGTHQLTVEFWMKWASYGPDDRLALEFTPNFNEHPGGFLVDPDATPGSDFAVSIGEGGSRNTVFFERPSAEAWHYYAFTIDTSAAAETQITPYVDGRAVSYTKSESGTGAGNFADSMLYWMSRDASSLFGEGDMQDLALYEDALGAETILEHYERGENAYRVVNTSPPSVEGSPRDGQTLIANAGTWSGGTPISYTYQWQSCDEAGGQCEDIEGATERSYELSSADLETKLRVRVTATNAEGSAESTSAATSLIESGAPDELEAPSIMGEPNVGETLSAEPGEWGGTGTEVGYQWERCNSTGDECADIVGATGPDFELEEGDIGSTLRLRVGVSNKLGSMTAVSQATEAVTAASLLVSTWPPSITGMDQSGQTLTAEAGSWLGEASISYSYQWQSCDAYGFGCEEIAGATSSSYALGSGNIGHGLRVRVSATETGGSVSETSATTQPVTDASAPEVETAPIVSGTGLVGYKLTVSNGSWAGEEPLSYSYQWVRCGEDGAGCSAISGATADSYTLKESDAASTVRVVVTATDAGSHSTEAVSPPLATSAATLVDVAAPSISGSDQEGQALVADAGIWTGSGAIEYAYQWKRCNEAGESCSSLSGATESSYTPVAGDVGHTLKVVVTGSGTAGTESVSSSATPVIGVEPFAPIEVEEPKLEGYGTVGDTLTAQHGLWAGTETISYSYKWQTCNVEGGKCKEIEGATGASYVLTESEIGSTVRVIVTATNTTGNESAPSMQSEVVAAPAEPEVTESPAIQGSLRVGVQAHLDNGVWTGSQPLRYYYQWQRCDASGEGCVGLEGATKASYTPESGEVGSTLRVRVTVSNLLGSTVTRTAAVSVDAATEASVGRALEAAEATDPSVLAPSTSATLEEQTVRPAIGETGEDISSSAGLTSSTISKETPGEFAVNAANGPLSFTPLDPPSNATTTPTIVNGTAAVFAETSHNTDTFVRPSPLGETTILQLRDAEAATSFTWEVGIGSDQELEELPNGDVAVIEPSSLPSLEAELPTEVLETPDWETTEEPEGEGTSGGAAQSELEDSLEEEGMLEPLPASPTATTAPVVPKTGELHPQETEVEYDSTNNAIAYVEEHTSDGDTGSLRPRRFGDDCVGGP